MVMHKWICFRTRQFFDTAEMYSVPAREETYGSTEIVELGLRKTGKEKKWFGFKDSRSKSNFNYMREKNDFSAASIKYALDNSLQRLQTDYIDLSALARTQNQLFWAKRI
jgi:aryl-alcohol dehydrogenase-like predicted oxidoreductase